MSFQLIYTSSPRLLDSSESGYGTVARSEKLPRAIYQRLSPLNIFREPRGGNKIAGAQFSYQVLDCAGSGWHVLSCVQPAGADYSGRGCYIAHHLILSQAEVNELLKSELRPTPAGLTLALQACGFWVSQWKGAPAYLTGEPSLSFDDLPDATAQPTWKRITGHKGNARALFNTPYSRDCLITISKETEALDVLRLFHESDWLTHMRGWGITYTTVADDADSFSATLRMVTTPESSLVQRAIRTGHPVLSICREMSIPAPEPTREPPPSLPQTPGMAAASYNGVLASATRSASSYHYTEEPDWLIYDVPPAGAYRTPLCLSALGVTACLLAGGWYLLDDVAPSATPDAVLAAEIQETPSLSLLTNLLQAPYEHKSTLIQLEQLQNIQETTPEHQLIQEVTGIVSTASHNNAKHLSAIKRLCEISRLLGVSDKQLVRLYLHEATHGISPSEWQKQFEGMQLNDWISLKQSEPQIIGLMQTDELAPYSLEALNKTAETTILATADVNTPGKEAPQEQSSAPGRISLIPITSIAGAELPAVLEDIIPQLPVSVTTGSFVVSSLSTGGEISEAKRISLSESGYRLYITPTETDGVFLLKPEHKEGKPAPIPAVQLTVKAGRLHSITSEGSAAIVSFPVPTKSDFHTNVILATPFGIPVPQAKGVSLPSAAKINLEITPDDLEFTAGQTGKSTSKVRLRQQNRFPWSLSDADKENIRFKVNIPVLIGHNSMQMVGSALKSYEWKGANVTSETESVTSLQCELTRNPDISTRLDWVIDQVLNSPCCGEMPEKNTDMTLGNLYYIGNALANDKLTRSEKKHLHQTYFSLFANKNFNSILKRILPPDTGLYLTPLEATANKIKALKIRNQIKKQLDTRAARDIIRKKVCEVLTRSVNAAYTQALQEQDKSQKDSPILILKGIDIGSHVELLWQFEMKQSVK